MRVVIGSDHGGYHLKENIKGFLAELGIQCRDLGTHSQDPVDYPDYGRPVAEVVARGDYDLGILVCGTGIGMSIVANKVPGIRAALCHDVFSARVTREHNDSNVLCLGGRVLGSELARTIVKTWLEAEFTGGRHARRVNKILAMEKEYGRSLTGLNKE